jgi:hypothetical protein
MFKLLSTANPKIQKGTEKGYLSFILHLAPADLSGFEVCPKRTVGCTAACLNTAGRGGLFKAGTTTNVIQEARIRKTKMFFEAREQFMVDLVKDIELAIKQSGKLNLVPVFRLNGTSDLSFEKYQVVRGGVVYKNIFEAFAEVQFYEYTKVLGLKVSGIKNYHLTFSAADGNDTDVAAAVTQGYNIAVVFGVKKGKPLPTDYLGLPVIDADDTDLRFLDSNDGTQVVAGLHMKGRAVKDTSGFVKYPTFMLKAA